MNEFLLDAHNEKVKPQDRVYNLGDLTMHRGKKWLTWLNELVAKLNGHKVLYLGNHDHFEAQDYLNAGFEDIRATWRDDLGIVYSHFPLHPESMGSARANVHGHTHDAPNEAPVIKYGSPDQGSYIKGGERIVQPFINVSVEMTNYRPLHIDELLQRIRVAQETYDRENPTIPF